MADDPAEDGNPNPWGELTYGSYLKVPELLSLQQPVVEGHSHDELLFIVIHQAYELWFKQILFELETVARLLRHDEIREATRLLERVVAIEKVLVQQIHILETMTPRDFCHFRRALSPASGFQSVQFREVEFFSGMKQESYLRFVPEGSPEHAALAKRLGEPTLADITCDVLTRHGFHVTGVTPEDEGWRASIDALLPVYREPEAHADIYRLCETLVSHDEWIGIWRYHHVRVVERIIGSKYGTGGSHGVAYLERTLTKRAFPLLWAVRTYLDEDSLFASYTPPKD